MIKEFPAIPRSIARWLACLSLAGLVGFATFLSAGSSASGEPSDVGALVEEVFRDALHTEEMDVDGQRVTIRFPPSESALRALRHHGDKAVPFIAEHLQSTDVEERHLAVALLGNQGGAQIVAPLRVALSDPDSRVRLGAVNSLRAAPRQEVMKILRATAEHDPDQNIREAAKKLLDLERNRP